MKCLVYIIVGAGIGVAGKGVKRDFIHIRGHNHLQRLPSEMASSWQTWTLNANAGSLVPVENHISSEGWVNPTSYGSLYLPADLPLPSVRPAVGFGISNGVARYLMPSVVLTLDTPSKTWRNRGICTLPRAWAWIDLFAENTPDLHRLRYSCYGRSVGNLRFLEDTDGVGAWDNLLKDQRSSVSVKGLVEQIQAMLLMPEHSAIFQQGFHFIDAVLPEVDLIGLPQVMLRSYITDIEDSQRLLEFEEVDLLDGEPCAELECVMQSVSAGGQSPYLPEVYRDLFEEGNILKS